ncbi:MAG: ABC transporter substrate-binding protein [Phycisphaerae bacterium]
MNKWWWLLLIILCLAGVGFIIFGTQQAQNRGTSPLPNNPNRIVSLAPSLTEILFALELDDKIVGVTLDSDYPPAAQKKTKVGTFWQPDTEAVIATKPDLAVTLQIKQQKRIADSLNRLGYRVLSLKIEKIEELFTATQKIGIATGSEQRADELIEQIKGQLNYLKSKYSSTNKPKVLWVVQTEPLRVAGRNTFINELIELLGGENAIGPTIQQYPPIGTEELLACNAEVIIQSSMGIIDIGRQQQQAEVFWSKWASLPAVKDNKIYVVDSDTVLRLGPRLPQGVEMVGQCLHPDKSIKSNETTQRIR